MAHNNELNNEMVNSFYVDMMLAQFAGFFVCGHFVFGVWNPDFIIIKVRTGHFTTRNSHRHLSFIKTNICNLSHALRERNEINFLSFSSFIAQPI